MKNIILYFIFFISPLLIISSKAEEKIVIHKGFNRKDVPDLKLQVLTLPGLKRAVRKELDIDVMVRLMRIDNGPYFKGYAQNTEPAYFYFDKDYNLKKLSKDEIKQAIQPPPDSTTVVFREKAFGILKNGKILTTFPMPEGTHYGTGDTDFFTFNKGQSLLIGIDYHLYIVKDINTPVMTEVKSTATIPNWAGPIWLFTYNDKKNICYIASWNNDKYPGKSYIYRIDPRENEVKAELFCETGPYAPVLFKYIPSFGALVYKNSNGNLLSVIDAGTGVTIHEIALDKENAGSLWHVYDQDNMNYIIIGNEIINLDRGTVEAKIPEFYAVSAAAISKDKRYLYYSFPDKSFTNIGIRCYDLKQKKSVAEIILSDVTGGSEKFEDNYIAARQLFLLDDNSLLVTFGTGVEYSGHDHLFEKDEGAYDVCGNAEANEAYKKGITNFNEYLFDKARINFESALAYDPNCVKAIYQLGITYNYLDPYHDSAIIQFKKAQELIPETEKQIQNSLLIDIGVAYYLLGDQKNAIAQFKTIVQDNPDYIEVNYNVERISEKMMHYEAGNAYGMMDKYDEAIKEFNKAIEIDTAYFDPYLELGYMYLYQKKYYDAMAQYEKCNKLESRRNWEIRELYNEIIKEEPKMKKENEEKTKMIGFEHIYNKPNYKWRGRFAH